MKTTWRIWDKDKLDCASKAPAVLRCFFRRLQYFASSVVWRSIVHKGVRRVKVLDDFYLRKQVTSAGQWSNNMWDFFSKRTASICLHFLYVQLSNICSWTKSSRIAFRTIGKKCKHILCRHQRSLLINKRVRSYSQNIWDLQGDRICLRGPFHVFPFSRERHARLQLYMSVRYPLFLSSGSIISSTLLRYLISLAVSGYLIRVSSIESHYVSVSASVSVSATTEQPGCWVEKSERNMQAEMRHTFSRYVLNHPLYKKFTFSTDFSQACREQIDTRIET